MEPKRITREKRTIEAMMRIYCHGKHGTQHGLCAECAEMLAYAHKRLDHCRYREKKPTCGNCPKHCYPRPKLEAMMDVMKYSGPRMTFRHPYFAVMHMIDGFKKAPKGKTE